MSDQGSTVKQPVEISLSDVDFGPEEERAVAEVVRSGWLSSGEVVEAFEEEFRTFVGAGHGIAVTNCTAALHLAFLALGIGEGDEVIVPSLTFVATVNSVRYTGAAPVFADVSALDDWCLSPGAVERALTARTRAIVPMHYAGFPCDMEEIGRIARENDLAIVEDAAHGPGSWFGDRHVGTLGDVGCFSFFANKNMTTGEGGLLATDDPDLAERLRYLRSHGMTSRSWDRYQGHAYQYDVVALGYNYRFDELRAALGRVQLEKLPENNRKRKRLYRRYTDLLRAIPEVRVPFQDREGSFSHHLCPVLLDERVDRGALMRRMRDRGVQTSIHYPPAHRLAAHRDLEAGDLPLTEQVGRRVLTLPLHPRMELGDVDRVVDALAASV